MTSRSTYIACAIGAIAIVMAGWAIIATARPEYALSSRAEHVRLLHDDQEIQRIYFERSSFVHDRSLPYRDVRQEYSFLGVAYFSLPRVFTNSPVVFDNVLLSFNAFLLCLLVVLTAWLLYVLRKSPWLLFLLCLPASLYFAFNRFDILMVVIVQASLVALLHERFRLAIGLLIAGFFVKWYSIIFIPVYIVWWQKRRSVDLGPRHTWKIILVCAGAVVIPLAVLFAVFGLESLFPFAFQASRGIEFGNVLVPYFAEIFRILSDSIALPLMQVSAFALVGLQITLPIFITLYPSWMREKLHTPFDVIRWMVIMLLCFLLFAKFYSPQYILWLVPLALLAARSWSDVLLIIALDLVHYFSFPLIYDAFGWESTLYAGMALARTLLYGLLLNRLLGSTVERPLSQLAPESIKRIV